MAVCLKIGELSTIKYLNKTKINQRKASRKAEIIMINYIMNLKMEHCLKKRKEKKKVWFCSCLPHSPHSYVGQQTHDVLQLDVSVRPKKWRALYIYGCQWHQANTV